MSRWRTYSHEISSELPAKCESDCAAYDFENDVVPIIKAALSNKEKLRTVNDSFEFTCKRLERNISKLFPQDIELDIILYLGLCNGAGWATTLGGKDVVLLGIEKVIELDWCDIDSMQGLIFHEVGHIWHKTYGDFGNAVSQKEKSINQLYKEGIAMVCEQILCDNDRYFHQNKAGWLDWCKQHEHEIKAEYLKRLRRSESTQDFFGDWRSFQEHSDVGYYLGAVFIRRLLEKYTLMEAANLSAGILIDEYESFADSR